MRAYFDEPDVDAADGSDEDVGVGIEVGPGSGPGSIGTPGGDDPD